MEDAMKCCGTCNEEPSLSDLLEDPMIVLLMARDGVTRVEVQTLMADLAIRPKNNESQAANCACRQ
jgi:hypothetical protein